MARYKLDPFDEANRLIQERGDWIVATVKPQFSWPVRLQAISYGSMKFILFPSGERKSAGVALRADVNNFGADEARKHIMQFCTALAWAEGAGLEIIAWGGGTVPRPTHVIGGWASVDYLQADHLPNPQTSKESGALAFYREGISLTNPFYAFLSLYKTISLLLPGIERANWIHAALGRVDDYRAKERREELVATGIDVGQYIREEGRNAIAHADRTPYVNPDEVDDHFRLKKDIPLMKNLAELAIEEKTDVRRRHTIIGRHLYELEGFRKILPEGILELLVNSEPVPEDTTVELPDNYTVIARKGVEALYLENMDVEIIGQVSGGVALEFVSRKEVVRIRVILNFAEERLQFDPLHGIGFAPNRQEEEFIAWEIALLEFQRCMLGNGRLEIWDAVSDTMLGRSEVYVPLNFFINEDFYDSELAALRSLLNNDDGARNRLALYTWYAAQ